jgi:ribosomal protein S18 acetylase RimI-like enzyme
VNLYSAAFVARYSRGSDGHRAPLLEPGVCGVVTADDDERRMILLLAIDDRAYGRFETIVPTARQGIANVFDTAARCNDFMRAQPGWNAERPVTAMVCGDIQAVPAVTLPDGLVLRPVNRLTSEEPDAIPLEDAAAVAIASDPGITGTADEFAGFLRALPSSVRLFAAVDERGVVRATSGCDVFGDYARVFFVNTEPGWRRRGVGGAMTVEALRAAASTGARQAFLDATGDGASVYTRLGFEVAGQLTRYSRAA